MKEIDFYFSSITLLAYYYDEGSFIFPFKAYVLVLIYS